MWNNNWILCKEGLPNNEECVIILLERKDKKDMFRTVGKLVNGIWKSFVTRELLEECNIVGWHYFS